MPHGRNSPLRKLVEWTFVSFDGVIDSPEWARPFLDDEHHRYALALLDESDALLLGRKTYEGFADFWPKQTGEIANRIRGERLFDGVEATVELRETTTFGSGVVVFRCGVRIVQTPP